MTLLKLELRPSSLANKLLFWMVLRAVLLAAAFVSFFLVPSLAVFLFLLWALSAAGYYFSIHRLALAVFTLACDERSGGAARRAPAALQAPHGGVSCD